jgi:hypothetical protein
MAAFMSDDARRGYAMLARLFLIVGGTFALLALAQFAGAIRLFDGDPLGVALIVLIIGVLLWWTVRTAPPADEAAIGEADAGEGDAGEREVEEPEVDERRVDEPAVDGRGVDPGTGDRG